MDPVTLAALVAAGGALFKGVTSVLGGIRAKQAAEADALQANQEAGVAAQQNLAQGDAVAARAATQAAANGGGFVGSSLGVISSLSQQAMFNARTAVYRGATQARSDLYSGAKAMHEGIIGGIEGVIGAGSSLLGGMADSAAQGRQTRAIQALGQGGYSADVAGAGLGG